MAISLIQRAGIVAGAISVLIAWLLVWPYTMQAALKGDILGAATAAWLQAFGGIGAIVAVIWQSHRQEKFTHRLALEARNKADRDRLLQQQAITYRLYPVNSEIKKECARCIERVQKFSELSYGWSNDLQSLKMNCNTEGSDFNETIHLLGAAASRHFADVFFNLKEYESRLPDIGDGVANSRISPENAAEEAIEILNNIHDASKKLEVEIQPLYELRARRDGVHPAYSISGVLDA